MRQAFHMYIKKPVCVCTFPNRMSDVAFSCRASARFSVSENSLSRNFPEKNFACSVRYALRPIFISFCGARFVLSLNPIGKTARLSRLRLFFFSVAFENSRGLSSQRKLKVRREK